MQCVRGLWRQTGGDGEMGMESIAQGNHLLLISLQQNQKHNRVNRVGQ